MLEMFIIHENQFLMIQQILFPWKFLTLQYELLYKEANKDT